MFISDGACMFFDKILSNKLLKKYGAAFTCIVLIAAAMDSCQRKISGLTAYDRGITDLYSIALRFAPMLYLHADEPYEIVAIIPVFHPLKPIVAYHIFFEDDSFFAGRGKAMDHEIVWVKYDPVTLKVADVFTLWHRTVLRTHACLMDAKASGQRPKVDVQWGQHGMLPYSWRDLPAARPQLELRAHYNIARFLNRIPKASAKRSAVIFEGSYDEYVRFAKPVDASYYMKDRDVVVAEHSAEELRSHLEGTFVVKKEWPDW